MKTTRIGNTGLTVSRICLGMMTYGTPQWRPWVLDEAASRPLVKHAVELGINFFDTADMYSAGESEVLTGKFLREFCRRDEIVIASKLYFPVDMDYKTAGAPTVERPNRSGLSRKRILHAVDARLPRGKPQARRCKRRRHLARADRRHRAELLLPRERLRHRRASRRSGCGQGREPRDAGLCVAAAQGCDGADHRREQAASARP